VQKKTILLVDNAPNDITTIRDYLEEEGYAVRIATDASEAKRIMDSDVVDLAILDIRLVDDTDETDRSGLDLARNSNQAIPKIILTSYPSYETVREALGPDLNTLPPAVGFVAKQEGLDRLLTSVKVALMPVDRTIARNLLRAFDVSAPVALPHTIRQVGSQQASERLHRTYDETFEELSRLREQETRQAAHLHFAGLVASALGIALIVIAGGLLLAGFVPSAIVSLVVSTLTNAVKVLFFIREDAAHQRVRTLFDQLQETSRISSVLVICDALESALDRDLYRKRIIDQILETGWLTASKPKRASKLKGR
jgi:CheY-like chemotaxis protein